ncbi:MAG: hypothetical protein ACTSU5_08265 [Promethearchaeota archaeon]
MSTLVEKPKKRVSAPETTVIEEENDQKYCFQAFFSTRNVTEATEIIVSKNSEVDLAPTTIKFERDEKENEWGDDFLESGPIPTPIRNRKVQIRITKRNRPLPKVFSDEWDDLPIDWDE